jgi:hypothetical protein
MSVRSKRAVSAETPTRIQTPARDSMVCPDDTPSWMTSILERTPRAVHHWPRARPADPPEDRQLGLHGKDQERMIHHGGDVVSRRRPRSRRQRGHVLQTHGNEIGRIVRDQTECAGPQRGEDRL